MAAGWQPTHVVPDHGLPTWSTPEPDTASDNNLDPGTEVEVLERQGEWAHVRCSNGWTAWVDGTALVDRAEPSTAGFIDQIAGNPLLAAIAVLVIGGAVSYLLWPVLAIPGKVLKDAIPRGNCTRETPGSSGMYFCSVKAGFLTALGPFIAIVVAIVFRRPISKGVQKLTDKLPRSSSTFASPVLATALFTLVHAAVHDNTADQTGIVPQRMFPALIGLFTFGASRFGPAIAQRWGSSIDKRNRVPTILRVAVALAVPLASSYFLTNQQRVSDTALKEQSIALLTLFTSYAAFVPRDGDFLGAGQRFLSTRLARGRAL